jgi:hypothetical protein
VSTQEKAYLCEDEVTGSHTLGKLKDSRQGWRTLLDSSSGSVSSDGNKNVARPSPRFSTSTRLQRSEIRQGSSESKCVFVSLTVPSRSGQHFGG